MSVITAAQFRQISSKVRARGRVRHTPGEMNRLENSYCEHLQGLKLLEKIADYKFESIKLRLANKTYYTADFAVLMPDGYVELHKIKATAARKKDGVRVGDKPLIEDDAAVKMKVAAEQYPWFQFVLVYRRSSGYWERREY